MESIINVENLYKAYGKTKALNGFSYTFGSGIYGLLGPNGSGKSTLMNILTDNLKYDSGNILYKGRPINSCKKEFVSHIGYMPQAPGLYPDFTALDYLNYISVLKGVKRETAAKQNKELLEAMELWNVRNDRIRTFSGGMKQRLAISQAFIGEPELVILDEPTAGLDPNKRIEVRNFISENALDKTVIIATHVVADVEYIARDIIMMKNGTNAETGSPSEITANAENNVWSVTCRADSADVALVKEKYKVVNIRTDGENAYIRIITKNPPDGAAKEKPTLEDRYLMLFGEVSATE